jgi:hypothetical protein
MPPVTVVDDSDDDYDTPSLTGKSAHLSFNLSHSLEFFIEVRQGKRNRDASSPLTGKPILCLVLGC